MQDSYDKSLTPRQRRFAERYAEILNGAKAAEQAGYSRRSAKETAARLLTNANVLAAVREQKKRLAEASFADAVHVIRELAAIAFADANDLMQVRRESCRHCHGFTHAYQWTDDAEFSQAMARFERETAIMPEDQRNAAEGERPDSISGFGFDPSRVPHASCPRCRGDGAERTWIADTTRLTGSGSRLYAGFKETRDGVQIITRDQDHALELLGKHLGMFAHDVNLKNDLENPIALLIAQVQGSAIKPVQNPQEGEE